MASVRDNREPMLLPTDWRKCRTSVSEEGEKHGALSPGAKSDPVQRNDLAPQLRLLAGSEGRFTDQLVADELAETIASADLVRGYQPLAARLLLQEQGREVYLPWRGLEPLDDGHAVARSVPAAALSPRAPETSPAGAGRD